MEGGARNIHNKPVDGVSNITNEADNNNLSDCLLMNSKSEGSPDRGLCAVCGEKAFYNFYGCLACDSCR